MDMAVAVTTTTSSSNGSSPAYVAKPPPPPPPSVAAFHKTTTAAAAAGYNSYYNGHAATAAPVSPSSDERRALDGVVLALRAAAALLAFVGASLVASCRHGDWMEFGRYHEYRYLLGASAAACLYSAAQALRGYFRRRRRRPSPSGGGGGGGGGLLGFAGDQLVAYMLVTAASAALPITIRMRSAVVNVFTDAMVAAIGMAFAAFAALALSAIISGFRISSSSY
jgi:hypothetical protein